MENAQQTTESESIVLEPQQFQPQEESTTSQQSKKPIKWILGLVVIIMVVGGAYIYFQRGEVQLENQKTFTQSAGIYSVNYPSDWTYSEGQLAARFETVKEGRSQTFDVRLGTDFDSLIKTLSQGIKEEKVSIKSNKFIKFISPIGTAYF